MFVSCYMCTYVWNVHKLYFPNIWLKYPKFSEIPRNSPKDVNFRLGPYFFDIFSEFYTVASQFYFKLKKQKYIQEPNSQHAKK
jgi:hypothetical protein